MPFCHAQSRRTRGLHLRQAPVPSPGPLPQRSVSPFLVAVAFVLGRLGGRLTPRQPRARIANPRLPSALHPEIFEVELVDNRAEGLVVDLAAVAEVEDGGALGGDDAALDGLVLVALLAAVGRLGFVDRGEVTGPVLEA